MPITPTQLALITEAHAHGYTDAAVARYAQVSLSSVKRYRSQLGLPTTSMTQKRGKQGERLLAQQAAARGLRATWPLRHDAPHDLVIEGTRVDVKTSMQRSDGTWRFRLPLTRPSFGGAYSYGKDYAADCELIALVALYPESRDSDVYFISSEAAPTNVTIRPGGIYDAFRNDWTALLSPLPLAA